MDEDCWPAQYTSRGQRLNLQSTKIWIQSLCRSGGRPGLYKLDCLDEASEQSVYENMRSKKGVWLYCAMSQPDLWSTHVQCPVLSEGVRNIIADVCAANAIGPIAVATCYYGLSPTPQFVSHSSSGYRNVYLIQKRHPYH